MLNKVKQGSQMYQWLNDNGNHGYTFNVIKGECPHQCSYCYCKKWGKQSPLHFDESELKTDLGSENFIFVGSSCDMWAETMPLDWIIKILNHCVWYDDSNKYLFQSKNPIRFNGWDFPKDTLLGTTIETNRHYPDVMQYAPIPYSRAYHMAHFILPMMVSIEPIMDFDLDVLVDWMREIKPQFVSIGANTNYKVQLPEPGGEKVTALLEALRDITEVRCKANLKRLLK